MNWFAATVLLFCLPWAQAHARGAPLLEQHAPRRLMLSAIPLEGLPGLVAAQPFRDPDPLQAWRVSAQLLSGIAGGALLMLAGGAMGDALFQFGGGRQRCIGGICTSNGQLIGAAIGGVLGVALPVIFVSPYLGGRLPWWIPALGAAAGAIVGIPLIFAIGPFALFAPLAGAVISYEYFQGQAIQKALEEEEADGHARRASFVPAFALRF